MSNLAVEKGLFESNEVISKISLEDMELDSMFSNKLHTIEILAMVWREQAFLYDYEEENILDFIVENCAEEFNEFVKTVQEMKTLFDKYQHGSEIVKIFNE